jgi:peptide/nickel transport system substrate-binding protein
MSFLRAAVAVLLALALAVVPAAAQELRIGLKAGPSSLDPQYQNIGTNNQIANHIFEPLVAEDARQQAIPALATSWKTVSDTVWEFTLRDGVSFQDGSPFTADDVVFTLERAAKVPNSPAPFTYITRQVTQLEVVDPLTLRLHTAMPAPLLPRDLIGLPILSHRAAAGGAPEGKTTAELNRGEGLVGTGPFRFVEWRGDGQLVLARNDSYWGPKPAWSRVTLRPITNRAARLAALLSGDVDLIEDPPSSELADLRRNPKFALAESISSRLIYIGLDQFAEPTPGVPNTEGRNPLKDKRVRQALSQAIDRSFVVDKAMAGFARPAGDFLPVPAFGTRKDAQPDKFDAAAARKLLAEAGYPNGFSITLAVPNGRYANDLKVAETVASMWSQIGVKTEVEATAPPAFFKNRDEYRYSAYLAGWNAVSGDISGPLRSLVATPNRERGTGGANRGRYSNPEMDARLDEAMRTVDDSRRRTLLQEASRLAMADRGLLPLHFEMSVWAMRRDLSYPGRVDQQTLAQFVTPRALSASAPR